MLTITKPPRIDATKYGLGEATPTGWKQFGADLDIDMPRRSVVATITTDSLDEDGEVVLPEGIDVSRFTKSGTVFWNHDYAAPCGVCDGLRRVGNRIEARTVFPERPDGHTGEWLADDVWALMSSDPPIVKAFSIGFAYIETRPPSPEDRKRYGDELAQVVSKARLLEYSIAPLPSNPDALATAVQKGTVSRSLAKRVFGEQAVPKPAPAEPMRVSISAAAYNGEPAGKAPIRVTGWTAAAKAERPIIITGLDAAILAAGTKSANGKIDAQRGRVYCS